MKIKSIKSQIARLPVDEPLADGPPSGRAHNMFVTVRIDAGDGIEGVGAAFFGGALSGALKTAIDELGALIVGEDPLRVEALVQKMRAAAVSAGPGGIVTLAVAGIDMALWDIKGKFLGQSLGQMIGGVRERVLTYASGALVRNYPTDVILKSAQCLVERGFTQMKTQMALPGDVKPAQEAERARLTREAVGPNVDLMCDINQRWSVNQAIDIGRRVEDVRFFWLEDVTAHDDYTGLARVADALSTPLASGECLYGITPFRHTIEAHAADIIMIDLIRVGGIANWLKVAALAEAFNLPVVSHLLPEIHVHLVSSIPNGLTVEYMPWSFRLWEDVPRPVKGELMVPKKAGLGLEFSRELSRYIVS